MNKRLYILEGRKRLRNDRYCPCTTEHIIGIFTSPHLAHEWVKTDGQTFYQPNYKRWKKHFYALLQVDRFDDMNGFLYCIFTKDGKLVWN